MSPGPRCPKCGLETFGDSELQFHVPRCGNMVDEFAGFIPLCLIIFALMLMLGGLFAALFGN